MSKEEKGNQGAAARKALDAMAKQAATNGAKRKDLLYSFPRVNTTSNREGRGGGNLFSQERVYFLPFFSASFPPPRERKRRKREGRRGGGGGRTEICAFSATREKGRREEESELSPTFGKRRKKWCPPTHFFSTPKNDRGRQETPPPPGMDGGGGCGAVAGNQYFSLYLGALAVPFYAFFPSLSLSCKNDVSRIFPSRSDTATSLRRHPSPPPKKKSF